MKRPYRNISENTQISDVQPDRVDTNIATQAHGNSTVRTGDVPQGETRLRHKKIKSDEEDVALSVDWKSVGHYLNKFYLFVSIASSIIITIPCFAILPNIWETNE